MKMRNKKQLIETWLNGNRSYVKKYMKSKPKLFAIDLISILVMQFGYQHPQAITEVRKMCTYNVYNL